MSIDPQSIKNTFLNCPKEVISTHTFGYGDIISTLSLSSKLSRASNLERLKFKVTKKTRSTYRKVLTFIDLYDLPYDVGVEFVNNEEYKRLRCTENFFQVNDAFSIVRANGGVYFWGYPFENLAPKHKESEGDYVCCWHTKNNLNPVQKWKNPIGDDGIIEYAESLGLPVKYIDYVMDPKDVIDTIRDAKLCVGYEGIGQYIAQTYMKPMITFSESKSISEYNSGPWALVTDRVTEDMYDVAQILREQNERIEEYRPRRYRN
jgi:hypothetical protein